MSDEVERVFEAVYGGDEDAVVRLLRSGTSAETADEDGETALYRAATDNRTGIVRLLLAAGADPDRASGDTEEDGGAGGDLPLCGAAVRDHEETVRALLAAGARPDLREAHGLTALVWAATRGNGRTVRTLLEFGADPELPDGHGVPPLVLAVRRGSWPAVRALLDRGVGEAGRRAALAEAHEWLIRDVEGELRAGLLEAYGEGHELVVRRVAEDGGTTVVVELLRDGRPGAGADRQTGHAAIATALEVSLGIRTPAAELAARALRDGERGNDNWREQVLTLGGRGDEETFAAAAEWAAGGDPALRAFGADVLERLRAVPGAVLGADGARTPPGAGQRTP
ncbi:ankyrin repeat domain-containing protein [Streptomyces inusitatus]|nr:ankyrin repeat domain-containing protein [Streptomyces inusitatus]